MAVINVHKVSKQAAANTTEGNKGCHGFLDKDVTDLLEGEENRKSRKKDYNPTGFSDFTFFFYFHSARTWDGCQRCIKLSKYNLSSQGTDVHNSFWSVQGFYYLPTSFYPL